MKTCCFDIVWSDIHKGDSEASYTALPCFQHILFRLASKCSHYYPCERNPPVTSGFTYKGVGNTSLNPVQQRKDAHSDGKWKVRTLFSQGDHQSSSTFSAADISSNMIWFLHLHDIIKWNEIKSNHNDIATRSHIMIYKSVWNLIFATKFSSINLAKGQKRLFFSTIIC